MIERDLVIVGDEAWTPEEWERLQRRRASWRAYYHRDPVTRIERARAWALANPERVRAHRRRSAEKHRRHPVGSLHGLACTGPTRATGCVCVKIKVYDKP